MEGENFPLGPGQRRFVGKEHFPGHEGDEDYILNAEERNSIIDQKNAIEDAILDNIDHPYLESAEFEEEMRESEKIQQEEEEKRRGWKTNFKSASGEEYPTESEAEILDRAIKETEKKENDYEELAPLGDPKIDHKKAVGKRDMFDSIRKEHERSPNHKRTHPRSLNSDKN